MMLICSGLYLGHMPTVYFGLGFLSFGFTILIVFYAKVAWRTGRLRKMIIYPLLDVARGLFFTFGGVTQLLKMLMVGRS